MKRFGTTILLAALLFQGYSQELSAVSQQGQKERKSQRNDNEKEFVVGRNFLSIAENDSSVNVRIGNRGLSILESLEGEGTHFKLERYERQDWDNRYNSDDDEDSERRKNRFKAHWTGIEIGFNNYTTSRSSHFIPDEIDYMTLHSGKSNNFNINFAQINLGLSRHLGFVTGLGLNWNNYRFDGNNNIIKGTGGMIELLDPATELEKSKLATLYLTVPFLLELQLPVNNNSLNIAAGPIGAVKLGSHSKMVFEDGNKVKSNSDFNLNILRCGGTVRFGFSNLQLFGTYYMTPLFRTAKGPAGYELYPFEVGVAFSFND